MICFLYSILVDYHNNFLNSLTEQTHNRVLQFLIEKLVPNQISIIQIALYNTGVIILDQNDCTWIEKVSQASLVLDKDYFPTSNTPLNFDFSSVQSYLIRTYLLLCHINYQHLEQKYQLYEPRKMISGMSMNDEEIFDLNENYSVPLENEWNHLNEMSIDKLYHGYNLLKQIAGMIKNEQRDVSALSVYEYLPKDDSIIEQMVQYQMRDFKLSHLNPIGKLYQNFIRTFDYSFDNISDLLRVPIDIHLSQQLQETFERTFIQVEYDEQIEQLQTHIQQINQLLHEWKSMEDVLLRQSAESLRSTCEQIGIENDILKWIPEQIKCENYVSLSIYLNQVQSTLQERKINIEEKTTHLWEETFHARSNEQNIQRKNRYHRYLHEKGPIERSDSIDNFENNDDEDISSQYKTLFQLYIASKRIPERIEQEPQKTGPVKRVQTFVITYPDRKSQSNGWKSDNLYEELRRLFRDKKYDSSIYTIVDSNQISIDFMDPNCHPPTPLPVKYSIVEKSMLISIEFHYGTQRFTYLALPDCHFSSLIERLTNDQQLQPLSTDSRQCFYDELGRFIEDGTIGNLYRINDTAPIMINIEQHDDNATLLEIRLGEEKANIFHPKTQWRQIEIWRKFILPEIDSSCVFWDKEHETMMDENQSIASTEIVPTTLDGIARDQTITVLVSFGMATQRLQTLKSVTVDRLFHNRYLPDLDMTISSNDYSLTVGQNGEENLSEDDLRKPVNAYRRGENDTINFRIILHITILPNDRQEAIRILLKDNTTTVEQLLQQLEMNDKEDLYLASNDTHRIFQKSESIINFRTRNFALVKESETCMVSIDEQSNRFMISATIADILKENSIDYSKQQLLYENDIVPAEDTTLSYFAPSAQFKLIDTSLSTTVTIHNTEDNNRSLTFYCSASTMNTDRMLEIVCQLLQVSKSYYCLHHNQTKLGEGIFLKDIETNDNRFEFQLISTATIKGLISYENRAVTVPCNQEAQVREIVKHALDSMHINVEDIDSYELFLINDDDRSGVGGDLTVEDLLQLLFDENIPSGTVTFKVELEKKND